MTWQFVAGFVCGAILFDVLWRFTFHKWMKLYDRQQEHYNWICKKLFEDEQ